jgi:hypothetical protein
MKNLDIYNGFVLRYDEAVKYLDDIAVEHTMAVMRGEEDSEGMTEILEDLHEMRNEADNMSKAEYFKFVECPMSASNINMIPMVEKGE